MLATEYTDFSLINTNGVTVADTFNSWRKSTNGIIQKLTVEAGSPTWDSTGKVSIGGVVQSGSATIVDIGVARNGSGDTVLNLGSVSTINSVVINRASGTNGTFTVTNTGTGLITLSQAGVADLRLLTSATERVRILAGGNVGIGTNNPDSLLHVNGGNFKVSGTITSGAIIGSGAIGGTDITASGFLRSQTLGIGNSNTAFTVSALGAIVGTALNAGAGTIVTTGALNSGTLNVGTVPQFTVSALGAIVGTALNAGSGTIVTTGAISGGGLKSTKNTQTVYTDAALISESATGDAGISLNCSGANAVYLKCAREAISGYAAGGLHIITAGGVNTYANVIVNQLDAKAQVTGLSFNSTSSLRYKQNVQPLSNALDIIEKLQGVTFDWKDTGKSDIGLIAEQVNEVVPEFVLKDAEGLPKAVDYGKLTAILIEAVKELSALVKSQN